MAPSTFAQFMEADSDEEDNLRGPSIMVTSPEGSTAAATRPMRPQSAASRGGRAPLAPPSPAGSLGAGLLGGSSKSSGSSKKKDKRGFDRHDLGPTDLLHGRSRSPQPGDESRREHSDSHQHSMTSLGPVDGLRNRSVSPAPGGGESRHSKRKDQSDRHSMTSIGPIDGLRNRSLGEDHMAGGGSKSSKHKRTEDADRHQPPVLGIGPIEGLRGRSPSPIPGRGSLDTPGAHDLSGSSNRAASRSRLEGFEDDKKTKKEKKEKKEKKDKKASRHVDEQADFEDSLDDLSAGASQWAPKRVDDHSHKERKSKKEKKEKHRDDDIRGDSFMSADERPSHEGKSKKDKKSKKEESERITGSRLERRTFSEDADLTGETTASSAHKGHNGRMGKKEKKEKAGSRAPVPALSRQNSDSGSLLDDDGFTLAEKADGEPERTVPPPPQSFGYDPGGDDDLMARLGGGGETASTLKASAPAVELEGGPQQGSRAPAPQRPTSAPQTSGPARPTPARPSPARPVSAAHTSLTKGRRGRSVARFLLRFEQGREALAVEWVDGAMNEISVPRSVLATARSSGTPAEGYATLARILLKPYPELLQPEHCKPVEALLKQLDDANLEAGDSRSAQRYIFSVTAAGGAPWAPRLPPASSESSWIAPEPRASLPLGAKLLVRARVRRLDGWWLNLEGYGGWIPETLTGGCCVERWNPGEAELNSWLREARPLVEATSTTKGGLQARTRKAVYDHLQPRG